MSTRTILVWQIFCEADNHTSDAPNKDTRVREIWRTELKRRPRPSLQCLQHLPELTLNIVIAGAWMTAMWRGGHAQAFLPAVSIRCTAVVHHAVALLSLSLFALPPCRPAALPPCRPTLIANACCLHASRLDHPRHRDTPAQTGFILTRQWCDTHAGT